MMAYRFSFFDKEIHIERGKPYQETANMIMAEIKKLSINVNQDNKLNKIKIERE